MKNLFPYEKCTGSVCIERILSLAFIATFVLSLGLNNASGQQVYEAFLSGGSEVSPALSLGSGNVSATLTDTTLVLTGSFSGLTSDFNVDVAGGAHIHTAYAGQNGGITIPLNATLDADNLAGTFEAADNTFELSADQLADLNARRFYVNIHTLNYPGGELRGQLLPQSDAYFEVILSGGSEVPLATTSARGALVAELKGDILRLSGSFSGLSSKANHTAAGSAHIHRAGAGGVGPITFPLQPAFDPDFRSGVFTATGNVIRLTPGQIAVLNRRGFYVNVHSIRNPTGEIRGQILPMSNLYFEGRLAGINEVPPNASGASGGVAAELLGDQLIVTGTFSGLNSDFNAAIGGGAHLHVGGPDVAGGVTVPLNARLDTPRIGHFDADGNTFMLSEEQLDNLLGGQLYANVHTMDIPAGEVRSQVRVSPNNAPPGPMVAMPETGASISSGGPSNAKFRVAWNSVNDPDNNPVVYIWQFSRSSDFGGGQLLANVNVGFDTTFTATLEDLDAILTIANLAIGMSRTFFHRVIASDGSASTAGGAASIHITRGVLTEPVPVTLQLLHASDLEAGAPAIEDAPRFSAVVAALRDDFPNTLVLSSGDNYIPGPFFDAGDSPEVGAIVGAPGDGYADIGIMNAIGFDASALGNHEFDRGTGTMAGLIGMSGDYPGTQFPYLSSNLEFGESSPLQQFAVPGGGSPQANSIAPSVVFDLDGESVGVIGATTPLLATISSPDDGITINPPDPDDLAALAAIIQIEVDALESAGVNKIILVSHLQQFDNEEELAGLLSGVDIIVAGGSDRRLADSQDRLRQGDEAEGEYPTFLTGGDGNPIAVVSTDGNYRYVGRLVIDFSPEGIIDVGGVDPNISGAFATDDQGVEDVGGTPNETVQAIVDAVAAVIEPKLSQLYGRTNVFLNGARNDVRTQETNLGNLTADANLWLARSVDAATAVSIKNGGGIRDNIGEFDPDTGEPIPPQANQFRDTGQISQLDIENALTFNNGLSLLTVTASELLALIEHGVSAVAPGATPGQFPQVGGLAFSFFPSNAAGSRVHTLTLIDDEGNPTDIIAQDGSVVGDPDRSIRLVTLDFLAEGGDGYPFPETDRVNLTDAITDEGAATFAPPGSEQDALAEYLTAVYAETPFSMADTPPEEDERIQNLAEREDGLPTATEGSAQLPDAFALRGNYPNPFNPSTTIVFDLPQTAKVTIEVFDMAGRKVIAVPAELYPAGAAQSVTVSGHSMASGVYVYQITAESAKETQTEFGRMVLLK